MNSIPLKIENPWIAYGLKKPYSFILNSPSIKTGKKKRDTIPCRCFLQIVSFKKFLAHALIYLLGDFFRRIKMTAKATPINIKIKYNGPSTLKNELSCIAE